jgi:hypothetical protein
MVIYEINLSINNEVFQEFYEWLFPHVQQILAYTGFIKAEIGMIENQDEDNKNHLRISYTIDSYDNLQNYLTHHAPQLRADALNQFGDKFNATRRVILETIVIDANKQ